MSKLIENILTEDEINIILNDIYKTNGINNHDDDNDDDDIYFKSNNSINQLKYINLSDLVLNKLSIAMNIKLNNPLPIRIVYGNTCAHEDKPLNINNNHIEFNNTYLYYLTDNSGTFVINNDSCDSCDNYISTYSIKKNTGLIFNSGLIHCVIGASNKPRVMIGPMNEYVESVGALLTINNITPSVNVYTGEIATMYISYTFTTLSTDLTSIIINGSINITPISISSPTFDSGQYDYTLTFAIPSGLSGVNTVVINVTGGLNASFDYTANTTCFLSGSKILCLIDNQEKYINIEDIKKGILVKTYKHEYVPVYNIGHSKLNNTDGRIYRCSKNIYPELFEDLYITEYHSILVPKLTSQQNEDTIKLFGKLYITDDLYRLVVSLDSRSNRIFDDYVHDIWHIALENSNYYSNYGIYANGLLVETCSKRFLEMISGMTLST